MPRDDEAGYQISVKQYLHVRVDSELHVKLLRIVGQDLIVMGEQVDVCVEDVDSPLVDTPPVTRVNTLRGEGGYIGGSFIDTPPVTRVNTLRGGRGLNWGLGDTEEG